MQQCPATSTPNVHQPRKARDPHREKDTVVLDFPFCEEKNSPVRPHAGCEEVLAKKACEPTVTSRQVLSAKRPSTSIRKCRSAFTGAKQGSLKPRRRNPLAKRTVFTFTKEPSCSRWSWRTFTCWPHSVRCWNIRDHVDPT